MEPLYHLENIEVERSAHDYRFRLRIVSFSIFPGERIALLGPSGCGKSTALDVLSFLIHPRISPRIQSKSQPGNQAQNRKQRDLESQLEGLPQGQTQQESVFTVRFPGMEELRIGGDGRRYLERFAALRRRHIGYILQTGGLLPFLSCRENILVSGQAAGLSQREQRLRYAALTAELGIGHLEHSLPANLSIGERQRAAIARALLPFPALVLADEPTAALDPLTAGNVMAMLSRLAGEQALVVVSHDHELVAAGGFSCIPLHVSRQETERGIEVETTLDDSGMRGGKA